VEGGSPAYDLFLADVVRDMTQKGRAEVHGDSRVFVPEERLAQVRDDLVERLAVIKVGDAWRPRNGIGMGPVSTAAQRADVHAGIARLAGEARRGVRGPGDARARLRSSGRGALRAGRRGAAMHEQRRSSARWRRWPHTTARPPRRPRWCASAGGGLGGLPCTRMIADSL